MIMVVSDNVTVIDLLCFVFKLIMINII
jgi:hypothetical protein